MLAAANLKMPAIGIDIDVDNREKFVANVYSAKPGEYRSYK